MPRIGRAHLGLTEDLFLSFGKAGNVFTRKDRFALGVGNAYKSGHPMAHSTNNFARMIKLQSYEDMC
jgi:hypothetical protein